MFYCIIVFPSSAQVKPESAHVEFLAPSMQILPAGCVFMLLPIFFLKKS